jgi:DNA polymerase-3 subunit alpha (Gram-positive type)
MYFFNNLSDIKGREEEFFNKKISIKGKIFYVDEAKDFYYLFVTDYSYSFLCKSESRKILRTASRKGEWFRFEGVLEYDSEMGSYCLNVDTIKVAVPLAWHDLSTEKRVELHAHSKMSSKLSILDMEELVDAVSSFEQKAVAITDNENVQIIPYFYEYAKRKGVKAIFGCELNVQDERRGIVKHVNVLVKNKEGLKNLYKIVSISHMNVVNKSAIISLSDLKNLRKGLLLGSSLNGFLLYDFLNKYSTDNLKEWVTFFDYIELFPMDCYNDLCLEKGKIIDYSKTVYEIAKAFKKPVVMSGDVHYLREEDREYLNAMIAGTSTKSKPRKATRSVNYFRSTSQMYDEAFEIFKKRGIAKEIVVKNSNKIAGEIEEFAPFDFKLKAPNIPSADQNLRDIVYNNAKKRYGEKLHRIIIDRIEKELKSIIDNGYAVIFLISADMVKKSLEMGYPIGSRGSVGSSLVAFLLGITEVNPLPPHYFCESCGFIEFSEDLNLSGFDLKEKSCPNCGAILNSDGHNIKFEVFMGYSGEKIPDIDVNFSAEIFNDIQRFLEEKFGRNYCYKAGTISTISRYNALKMAFNYFKDEDMNFAHLFWVSQKIKGAKLNTGQHPSAMIIIPQEYDVHDFTPYQYSANSPEIGIVTTHYDFKALENDLLKIDVLSHDGPTFLKMLKDLTGYDYNDISMHDERILSLFSSTKELEVDLSEIGTEIGTLGVPEVWTPFSHKMLTETKPKTFYDLCRTNSLAHGTDIWFNNAREIVLKNVAGIDQIVSCRDDILTTLEYFGVEPKTAFMIMEKVRKGKELTEKELKEIDDSEAPEWYLDSLKKIHYLFPKAHAVAYMIMAYKIAFYKLYYPLEFYSVYFTIRARFFDIDIIMDEDLTVKTIKKLSKNEYQHNYEESNFYSTLKTAYEMRKRGFGFLRPDLYKSEAKVFKIEGKYLRIPLTKVRNIGSKNAQRILKERAGSTDKTLLSK